MLYTFPAKICSIMLFSQETFFQDCDDEPQAEDNQVVQVNIWKCVAALEFLTRDFDQASRLLKNTKTDEVVYVKEFLTTVIDLGEHMKRNISQLLELAKENMFVYERMRHYDNATTKLTDIPSRDPGLRPSTLTYNQWFIGHWFRKGHFNQSYQVTPKTKAYQLANKHNSLLNGTSYTHIWNTASLKTQFSVLPAHCSTNQPRRRPGASAVYLPGTK